MVTPRTMTAMSMDPYREPAWLVVVRVVLADADADVEDLVAEELEPVEVADVVRLEEDVELEEGELEEESEPEELDELELEPGDEAPELWVMDPVSIAEDPVAVAEAEEPLTEAVDVALEISMLS